MAEAKSGKKLLRLDKMFAKRIKNKAKSGKRLVKFDKRLAKKGQMSQKI